jgi:hypothetical protein
MQVVIKIINLSVSFWGEVDGEVVIIDLCISGHWPVKDRVHDFDMKNT